MSRKAFEASLRPASDRAVEVIEVGTRDGLQIESKLIRATDKIDIVNRMIDAATRTIDESIGGFAAVADKLHENDIGLISAIATPFGCPFEGDVAISDVLRIAEGYVMRAGPRLRLNSASAVRTAAG